MNNTIRRIILLCGILFGYVTVIYLLIQSPQIPHTVDIEQVRSVHFVGDIQNTDTGVAFRWVDTRVPVFVPIHVPGSIVSFKTWLYPTSATTPAVNDIVSIDKRAYASAASVFVPRTYHVLSLYSMSNRHDKRAILFVPYNMASDTPYWAFSGVKVTPLTMQSLHLLPIMVSIPLVYALLCWYATRRIRTSSILGMVVATILMLRTSDMYAGYYVMCYLHTLQARIIVGICVALFMLGTIALYRRFGELFQRVLREIGVHLPTHHHNWFYGTAGIVSTLWAIVIWRYVSDWAGDWGIHINSAYAMMNYVTLMSQGIVVPHFLFHITLIALHYLSIGLLSLETAAVVLVFGIIWFISLLVWNTCARVLPRPSVLVGAVLLTTFSAPIALFYPTDGHLYFGYFATNVFHNPTVLMVKPFALMHFLLIIHSMRNERTDNNVVFWITLWVITFLGVLAKPSYAIAIVPAHGIILVWRLWQRHPQWRHDIITFVTSTSALVPPLLFQFMLVYGTGPRSIGFKSLSDMTTSVCMASSQPWWSCIAMDSGMVMVKGVASVAFLLCILFTVPRIIRYGEIQLAGLASVISIAYVFVLGEGVKGAASGVASSNKAGNSGWSIQIMLFIFMVVALPLFARALAQRDVPSQWVIRIPFIVAVFHLVSGIIWYATQFTRCCW